MNQAYITIITNKKFYPGVCALLYSLKQVKAKYPLVVLIPDNADTETKELVRLLDIMVIEAPEIEIDSTLIAANRSKRWNETFFKLQVFGLTQFDKLVFLDADMVLFQNIDELFERPHMSAVPAGICAHPDYNGINSGMMVLIPDAAKKEKLISAIIPACNERINKNLGFGDQDVIKYCYPNWYDQKELVLHESYNVMHHVIQTYSKLHGYNSIKVFHYAEHHKPWQFSKKEMLTKVYLLLLYRYFHHLRALLTYRKYIKKSCPNYLSYNEQT